jgi:hypothetical protein
MHLEITQRGVYGHDGLELPVGRVVEVEGAEVPGALVNKSRVIPGPKREAPPPEAPIAPEPKKARGRKPKARG